MTPSDPCRPPSPAAFWAGCSFGGDGRLEGSRTPLWKDISGTDFCVLVLGVS